MYAEMQETTLVAQTIPWPMSGQTSRLADNLHLRWLWVCPTTYWSQKYAWYRSWVFQI